MFVVWWYDKGEWNYYAFGDDFDSAWDLLSTFIRGNGVALMAKDERVVLQTERAREETHAGQSTD